MRRIVVPPALFSVVLCSAQVSMNVDLLYQWNDTTIPDNGGGATFNDTWGFVQNGAEYGVIGSTLGTHIFRITDTDSLIEVARVPGAFQGAVVHRDFKTFQGHLYGVCQQGTSTLQIVDLGLLPDTAVLVYDSDALVTQAHNVYIDTATARLYVCGPNGHAMSVYDLDVPDDPQLLAHFDLVTYVHDAFVRNDTAYLNCGDQGLFVYDFSDPATPVLLGTLTTYPQQGYNHSGWLSADGGTYVFADESEGRLMKVCSVNDLSDITVLGFFNSGVDVATIPHNLMLKNGLVYVSHYNDGLRIFDVSDPLLPVQVGYYDTWDHPFDGSHYRGAWGVYAFLPSGRILISDRQSGLYLFRFNMPEGIAGAGLHGGMRLFPNPNSGVFDVVAQPAHGATLSVADAQGRTIWRSTPYTTDPSVPLHVDLSGLSPGIYSLHMQGDQVPRSARFVVE